METSNNIKVILNTTYILSLVTILGLGILFAPVKANAQYYNGGTGTAYPGTVTIKGYNYNQQPTTYPQYYPVPTPVYVPTPEPVPTPTVYSSTVNPNAPRAVAKAKTDEVKKEETKPAETAKKEEATNKYGDLLAGVIFGTDGFMPSGLTGWIFFAILILGAVILVRKAYGGSEKYYSTPLKHK